MKRIVAIVGRPNVGKSTLFNRLIGSRKAIVDDTAGVTVDLIYGSTSWNQEDFEVIDTMGIQPPSSDISLKDNLLREVSLAIEEAAVVIFLTDGKEGLTENDKIIAGVLRKSQKPVFVVVNKIDNFSRRYASYEFYELGWEKIYPISALHGLGISELLDDVVKALPPKESQEVKEEPVLKITIVGRPNVGKSTMVNKILGRYRVKVSPEPGTTRDPIEVKFQKDNKTYMLIDTAGIRRKARIKEKLEKISVEKAMESVELSDIAILLIDATEGPTDQDLRIGGYIQKLGKGCIIGINKWDLIKNQGTKTTKDLIKSVKERFKFIPYAPIIPCSALTGKGIARFFSEIDDIYSQYQTRINTGLLNRTFQEILSKHGPPQKGGKSLKFYYITQPSTAPPAFVIFCNNPENVHFSYERYLTNQLRAVFNLDKTPIKIIFRGRS